MVAAAEWLQARAYETMKLGDEIHPTAAKWTRFVEKVSETDPSISEARTALLLEAEDAARVVLAAFSSASGANTR